MPSSPCVKICEIDPQSGFCTGCLRSMEEIVSWSQYSETQRAYIMQTILPEREKTHPHLKSLQS